jgi:hypothetical protein
MKRVIGGVLLGATLLGITGVAIFKVGLWPVLGFYFVTGMVIAGVTLLVDGE